jgi:hypothetical protein
MLESPIYWLVTGSPSSLRTAHTHHHGKNAMSELTADPDKMSPDFSFPLKAPVEQCPLLPESGFNCRS